MSDWYEEKIAKIEEEQKTKTRDEVTEELRTKSEHVFDPSTAAKQNHLWVDRGLVLSCENAGHSYHQAWKRKPMY